MNRSDRDRRFEDWKAKASDCDLLETAKRYGSSLKRLGKEHTGPCPACGGTDRFSINVVKNKWHCRGHGGGGGAIGLAMHVGGLTFLQAIEDLTGEPNPNASGPAKPLSEEDKAERNRRRVDNEARQITLKLQEMAREESSREYAAKVWGECIPLAGTDGERYLHGFGLPTPPDGWPACLGFHPALQYPDAGKMPALVARVDDLAGNITGVWREFISSDCKKANVELQKMGLGPVAGGAVRLGGHGKTIGVAEGVRTSLGAWALIGFKYPVWSCLSTAGLLGFEVPLGVTRVVIYPDSDQSIKRQGAEYVPTEPAGRKAALAMQSRLRSENVTCVIAAMPAVGRDYLNVWQHHILEDA